MCAILATCLCTTRLNQLHDADSVLFQLHSFNHWTPYFWEQDRVGMLWPLLTKPITHPLANLFTQTAITTFCGLAFPFLMLRLLDRTTSYLSAILVNFWLIGVAPDLILNNWFIVCVYPSALFLGTCGLLVFEEWDNRPWLRFVCGLGLLMLAHWIYIAAIVVLGPLAVARVLLNQNRLVGDRIALLATLIGFGFGFWLMKYCQTRYPGIDVTPLTLNPPSTWFHHFKEFVFYPTVKLDWLGLVWFLGAACLSLIAKLGQLMLHGQNLATHMMLHRSLNYSICVLPFIAIIEVVTVSMMEWPCRMDHHPRYLMGTWSIFSLVCLAEFVLIVQPRHISRFTAMAIIALFLVSLIRFGPPSVDNVRSDFDMRFGRNTDAFLTSGADALGDEYWHLWPAVFHIELTRFERGLPPMGNVVGLRSCAYWSRWKEYGERGFLVAVPKPVDPNVDPASGERGLAPFEFVREDENFVIYRTRIVFRPFPGKPAP